MKILGSARIPQQVNNQKTKSNQSFRGQMTSQEDTFTKSTTVQMPLTLNLTPEQSQKILNSPDLLQKLSSFVSNGLMSIFMQLVDSANGASKPEEKSEPIAENAVEAPVVSKEQQKIEELQVEIAKLKEENKAVKEELHNAVTKTPVGYSEGVIVKYPRKLGMSKEEKKLEQLVTSLILPEDNASKLTDVIIAVHDKKEKNVRDGYITRLYKDLSENKFDTPKLLSVVEDYFNELYSDEIQSEKTNSDFGGEVSASGEKLVNVDFPKRKGLMSKELNDLKTTVELTKFPEQSADKLKVACAMFSVKGTNKFEVANFAREIQENQTNSSELARIIDRCYNDLKTRYPDAVSLIEEKYNITIGTSDLAEKAPVETENQETTVSAEQNTVKNETEETKNTDTKSVEQTSPTEEVETFKTESEKQKIQLKVIGNAKIDPVEEARRKARIARSEARKNQINETGVKNGTPEVPAEPKTPAVKETEKTKNETPAQAVSREIESPYVDRNSKFYFKMPKEKKRFLKNTGTEINQLIRYFKKTINPLTDPQTQQNTPKIPWLRRPVLRKDITEQQIIAQLNQVNSNPNKEHYHIIKPENAHEFVDVLNQKCFKGLMNIHSAMRLVDRFIDPDSDVPYTKQAGELVACLKNLIHKSLDLGVNFEVYDDYITDAMKPEEERKVYKGVTIIIPPEYFDEKERKYFGDKPIKIAMCDKIGEEGTGAIATVFVDKNSQPIKK